MTILVYNDIIMDLLKDAPSKSYRDAALFISDDGRPKVRIAECTTMKQVDEAYKLGYDGALLRNDETIKAYNDLRKLNEGKPYFFRGLRKERVLRSIGQCTDAKKVGGGAGFLDGANKIPRFHVDNATSFTGWKDERMQGLLGTGPNTIFSFLKVEGSEAMERIDANDAISAGIASPAPGTVLWSFRNNNGKYTLVHSAPFNEVDSHTPLDLNIPEKRGIAFIQR